MGGSFCMCVCLYVHKSVCPHVHMSICPYVHMSICPYVRMSVCPYVRMSICPYIHPLSHASHWFLASDLKFLAFILWPPSFLSEYHRILGIKKESMRLQNLSQTEKKIIIYTLK